MQLQDNTRFLLIIGVAIACLGTSPLFEKIAVRSGAGLLPLVITIHAVIVAIVLPTGWQHRPRTLLTGWRALLVIGLLAGCLVALLKLWALETTSATHQSVFQAMYPAVTALFAYWILRERLPLRGYLTIGAMVVGIILLSGQGFRWRFVFGDLLLFATLPMMGFCDAWVKRSLADLSPQWIALGRFTVGTAALMLITIVWYGDLTWPTGRTWLWVVLAGSLIGIGVLMLYRGMVIKGASLAAGMLSLTPVVTAILEWLFLGERFTPWELLGMSMIIVGGFLLSRPSFQGEVGR